MEKEDLKKLDKSELLSRYLFSRDNLISIKMRMIESQKQHPELYEDLLELFDLERIQHDVLLNEIFRRMK